MVNYARHLGIDPESALRRSNEKFLRRFRQVEDRAADEGVAVTEAGLEQLDRWWEDAKRREGAS
jgi:uncharacterized protein YabN with tetrapyrrole methylase and pyrophosphatase domain